MLPFRPCSQKSAHLGMFILNFVTELDLDVSKITEITIIIEMPGFKIRIPTSRSGHPVLRSGSEYPKLI